MSLLERLVICGIGLVFFVGAISPIFADEGPVSLNEIRTLREEKKPAAEIMSLLEARGRGFEMNVATAKALRQLGFPATLIGKLRKIEMKQVIEGEKLKLTEQEEAYNKKYESRIQKAIEKSQLDLAVVECGNHRLVGRKDLVEKIKPDVLRVESILQKNFPEPIASSVDKRASYIAIFEYERGFETWVDALLKAYEEDGFTFAEKDVRERIIKGKGMYLGGEVYISFIAGLTPEQVRRQVAYAVGYHTMSQLGKHPSETLTCGFGNITEVMLFRTPGVTVAGGYQDRDLGRTATPWAALVMQRFQAGKINSIERVLAYSTSTMMEPQYAECWSFTTMLARRDPKKFAELVVALREKKEPLKSIQEIYGFADEKAILTAWYKFAQGVR